MSSILNKTKSSLIALVLLALAITIFVLLVINPWLDWRRDNADQMSAAAQRIGQFRAIVQSASNADQLPRLQAQIDRHHGEEYLQGDSDAIILADLQTLLGNIVNEEGCQMALVRQLPEQQKGDQYRLGLNLQIRGDIRAIINVLYRIETQKPVLFIERANLRLLDGAALAAQEGQAMVAMSADINVFGVKKANSLITGGGS